MRVATGYAGAFYRFDTHRRWTAKKTPEWFDHRADLYRFRELRRPVWAERGVYARELMHPGHRVLDLCCGDGFFSFHFYSSVAEHVDACDRDSSALSHARSWHDDSRITYSRSDVVTDPLPASNYDVIVWDAAIEHFSFDDIQTVLAKVKAALKPNGVLCGYTILNPPGTALHPDHLHEFASAVDLANVLRASFPYVVTLETEDPERRNIYFRASTAERSLGGFHEPPTGGELGRPADTASPA